MVTLMVNGKRVAVDAESDTPLLWVLRGQLGLTGAKFGCGVGVCGACTVLVNGNVTRSCSVTLATLAGAEVQTLEGLLTGADPLVARIVQTWIAEQASECGYCTPGMIVTAVALLRRSPQPTDAEISTAITNLCRCGTYQRVRKVIHRAARP